MAIVIFGDLFNFPEGSAATNRVYTYAKGFKENDINVHVICFLSEYRSDNTGTFDGIHYYYPFGQKERSKSFVARRWKNFLKYFKTYSLIRQINKTDRIVAINSWTNLFWTHSFAWFLSKILNTKLIVECSEHPLRFYQQGVFIKKTGLLKLYLESRLCDGIFCISKFLLDFYNEKGIDSKKLLLVPSTVDPGRFEKPGERPLHYHYIGYFGSLTFKRDNVDSLIKAFAKFSPKNPKMHLVLGGFCDEHEKKNIRDLICQLGIQSKVELIDYLKRNEIVKYISHADVLVMVRGKDLESQASYPSKLTEFLATSRPVVTVDIGEVSMYLTDGVNAFIVEQGNVDALAEKLDFVVNNYQLAEKVGQNGKELTEGVFNYNYQAKKMISFIDSI